MSEDQTDAGAFQPISPSAVAPHKAALDSTARAIVWPRLLIGLVVLICAEVFSGASLKPGLWNPWTGLVTFWLYFAHFFFFTTLAVRTRRTSLGSLYLWGVLFGLYESWITKVIWHGYGGDGKFVMGHLGPYGFSEMSMVFIFHPVMAFILPLTVAGLLCPSLRRLFPDLAWLTGKSKGVRGIHIYLVVAFAPIVGLNSGGPLNLVLNLVFVLGLLLVISRLARPGLATADGRDIVVFGRRGFIGLCLYLALLYGVTYVFLRPEGLPSIPVQLFTFVFYALAITGLCLYRPREPASNLAVGLEARERRLPLTILSLILGLGFACSFLNGKRGLFLPVLVSFAIWTPLGCLLMGAALLQGIRERMAPR